MKKFLFISITLMVILSSCAMPELAPSEASHNENGSKIDTQQTDTSNSTRKPVDTRANIDTFDVNPDNILFGSVSILDFLALPSAKDYLDRPGIVRAKIENIRYYDTPEAMAYTLVDYVVLESLSGEFVEGDKFSTYECGGYIRADVWLKVNGIKDFIDYKEKDFTSDKFIGHRYYSPPEMNEGNEYILFLADSEHIAPAL